MVVRSFVGNLLMRWCDPALRTPLALAWSYMKLVHAPIPADAILVLGSFDPHAAKHASTLWRAGLAPIVIMSGGIAHEDDLASTGWDRCEAEVFADVAISEGVPRSAIWTECEAKNTSENFSKTRKLAEDRKINIARLIVVAKPYMTRRAFATARKVWPEIDVFMQCEDIEVVDYFSREPIPDRTLQVLVGDLHRITVYSTLGFQIEQAVPFEVKAALRDLAGKGFGGHLLPGHPV